MQGRNEIKKGVQRDRIFFHDQPGVNFGFRRARAAWDLGSGNFAGQKGERAKTIRCGLGRQESTGGKPVMEPMKGLSSRSQ